MLLISFRPKRRSQRADTVSEAITEQSETMVCLMAKQSIDLPLLATTTGLSAISASRRKATREARCFGDSASSPFGSQKGASVEKRSRRSMAGMKGR